MRAFLAYEAPITDRYVGKMKVLAKVNAAWAEAANEDVYFCAIKPRRRKICDSK